MKRIFPSLVTVTLALCGATATQAAFNPEVVAADARWVIHVDLVALRESTLGKSLLTSLQAMAPVVQEHGVQPDFEKILATVGTVTAYGTNLSKNPKEIDGALIAQGQPELRSIVEALVLQASVADPEHVAEITGLPFEAYKFQDIVIGFPKELVVLASKSQTQLVNAYEVFRGRAPSLAKKPASRLNTLLPKGGTHFLVVASEVPDVGEFLPEGSSQSRILRMATAGAFALGESDSVTAARLQLMASSDDMGEKLSRILQGMVALVGLAQTSDNDLNTFLQSISSDRKGNIVSFSLSYPSDRLVTMVEDLQRDTAAASQWRQPGNRGRDQAPENRPASPAETDGIGQVVATWLADADLPGDGPSAATLTSRVADEVTLAPGATITISGRRGGGEHARVDYIEIAPLSGTGAATRIEAEYMRLENYGIEKSEPASGGEIVRLHGPSQGYMRYIYLGAAGTYRVTVGYVDENDGQSSFALGVQTAGTR